MKNTILEVHDTWYLIDISTPKHPKATMAVDCDVWDEYEGGRVCASKSRTYLRGVTRIPKRDKTVLFHHLVVPPKRGLEIDHIKHGTMEFIDNRRSNLRHVTSSQNTINRSLQSNNRSGMPGVFYNKKLRSWGVYIQVDGRRNHLGHFDNIEIAVGVRLAAEKEYFGDYRFKSDNE